MVTRVPKAQSYLTGVINLRGNVVPVVNLRKRFGINEEKNNDNNTRIIILNVSDLKVGIIVDSVTEVQRITKENIEEPNLIEFLDNKYVQAVGKHDNRLIILLDLQEILELGSENNDKTANSKE